MHYFKIKPLKEYFLQEATFSAKNFPLHGNEDFSGAGERTNYVDSSQNDNKGFPVSKATRIIKPDGIRVDVDVGDSVYITKPGTLVRGDAIGAPDANGVYTKVSLTSPDDFLGYIKLSIIEKPAGKNQARVSAGASSQNEIADYIKGLVGEKNFEFVSTAKKGSTVADLIVKVNGQPIQFEIKGANSNTAPITFFDKSYRRGQSNEILDDFASVFTGGRIKSFTSLVDEYRNINPSIGFPGDEGVIKSGRLPAEFIISDARVLNQLRTMILHHFAEGGDNYFAVHYRGSAEPLVFYTGVGTNVLDMPLLPPLKSFRLASYGGPSNGAMRIGIKITL